MVGAVEADIPLRGLGPLNAARSPRADRLSGSRVAVLAPALVVGIAVAASAMLFVAAVNRASGVPRLPATDAPGGPVDHRIAETHQSVVVEDAQAACGSRAVAAVD